MQAPNPFDFSVPNTSKSSDAPTTSPSSRNGALIAVALLVAGLFAVVCVCSGGIGLLVLARKPADREQQAKAKADAQGNPEMQGKPALGNPTEKVRRASFNRLRNGMSLRDVESILGPGEHEVRNVGIEDAGMNARAAAFGGSRYSVHWRSRDGTCVITGMFDDDSLTLKLIQGN